MEEAAVAVKIYVMVTAEVGIEDVKQGMNGTEKDAKKSAREKVKDKRKKRGRAPERAGKTKGAETNTDLGDLDYIASPWPFFDRMGEHGTDELKETVKTEGRSGLKDWKSFR